MRRVSELLTLLVALFVGAVPLQECRATDTCEGGTVVIGLHAHHDHGDGSSHESPGHECDRDGTDGDGLGHDGDDDHGACCVDMPVTSGLPAAQVRVAPPVLATMWAAVAVRTITEAPAPESEGAPVPDTVPRGTRTVVLLR